MKDTALAEEREDIREGEKTKQLTALNHHVAKIQYVSPICESRYTVHEDSMCHPPEISKLGHQTFA